MSPMLVNFFGVMIVLLVLVGIDLLLGAKGMVALGRLVNHKVDVDNAVMKGLADLRLQGEKEIVKLDEAAIRGRLRIFLALLLLVPAAMLFFVLFVRK